MNLFDRIFNRDKTPKTISVPTLYPMGAFTFAVACGHCKNVNSEKCSKCMREIESGFELDYKGLFSHLNNLCVCCGEEIPEGKLFCSKCER